MLTVQFETIFQGFDPKKSRDAGCRSLSWNMKQQEEYTLWSPRMWLNVAGWEIPELPGASYGKHISFYLYMEGFSSCV